MKNQCIGCKRDISKGQSECPICGAPQSFVSYYRTTIITFVLVSVTAAGLSHWYINKTNASVEIEKQQLIDSKTLVATQKIEQLESELQKSKQDLIDVNEQLSQLASQQSNNSSQAAQLTNELKSKLAQVEATAKKQSDRAGWLGRENRRLKTEIETLKNSQAKPLVENSNATQLTNLNTQQINPTAQTAQQEESDEKQEQVSPPY